MECSNCQRKFSADRVEKHQTVCKPTDNTQVESTGSNSKSAKIPKWKQDREKMKQLMKRDTSKPELQSREETQTNQSC